MKSRLSVALVAIVVLVSFSATFPFCYSETTRSYQLLDHVDGFQNYRLNVAVPDSLHDYYLGRDHRIDSASDFAKFVTPYTLTPISNSLLEIYTDNEDFTNGVLMVVHQISYEVTMPTKYPIETIVDNKGDCDLLSYIAASITKAHGLDTVLLYYENEAHMNIGVSLPQPPQDARTQVRYVTHNNIRYYVAECTGGEWQTGWRVGECPDTLLEASPTVVTLEDSEQYAPAQVTASYRNLEASNISMTIDTRFLVQGGTLAISGQLSPRLENQTVTIYIRANNSPWRLLDTTTTHSDGVFGYGWNPDVSGICYIRASWSGDETYAAADSSVETVLILSSLFIALISITIILVPIAVIIALLSRQARQGPPTWEPPETPS
jgi:hypothetical protein